MNEEKKQQISALGRLGWSLRRIQRNTGVRRETAALKSFEEQCLLETRFQHVEDLRMDRLVLIALQQRVFFDWRIYRFSAEMHSRIVLDPEYELSACRLIFRNEPENLGKVFLILTLLVESVNLSDTPSLVNAPK